MGFPLPKAPTSLPSLLPSRGTLPASLLESILDYFPSTCQAPSSALASASLASPLLQDGSVALITLGPKSASICLDSLLLVLPH